MAFYLPVNNQQFTPRDATSYADCAASAGATLADADSKGKLRYTHGQVRKATNEPVPDMASPGLHWGQVDAALFDLSGGRVNLDVRSVGTPFAPVLAEIRAGKWAGLAVWRQVLVSVGLGGTSRFGLAHAVVAGYDQDRKVYLLGDPLVPKWQDVSSAVLTDACRQFIIRSGGGAGATGAYVALTRDIYDETSPLRYSAIFEAGSFWVYDVSPTTQRVMGRESLRFSKATSAPCSEQATYLWPGKASQKLVRITRGPLKGRYVKPGTTHVSLRVSK